MATKPKQDADTFVAPHERQQIRSEAAQLVAEGLELSKRGVVMQGQGLLLGQTTYSLDEQDKFQAWATKQTKRDWETCRSMMAIAKAQQTLPRKADREKAASLTFEQGQVLASVPAEDRVEWLSAIQSDTTPTEARAVRDAITDGKLSEEDRKAKAEAKAKRDAKTAADKTKAIVDDIRDVVLKAESDGDIRRAMALGASLVNGPGRTGEKVAEAIAAIFLAQDQAQAKIDEALGKAEARGEAKAKAASKPSK